MKANWTLDGTRLKKEPIRNEGEVVGHEAFWLVTVKVPADKIDANALAHLSNELLSVDLNSVQGKPGL